MFTPIKLTREEPYELVWSKPVSNFGNGNIRNPQPIGNMGDRFIPGKILQLLPHQDAWFGLF